MSTKMRLAYALDRYRLLTALDRIRARLITDVRILAYHRVFDLGDEDNYPFDPELVSATPEEFKWQIRYLKQHFNPITFKHLLDALEGCGTLPERSVIITFDDGFEDNYSNAYPVLRAYTVPATIFLSTAYIGSGRPFWFERLMNLFFHGAGKTLQIDQLGTVYRLPRDLNARRRVAHDLIGRFRGLSNVQRLQILDDIEAQLGDGIEPDNALSRPLTWDQLREMAAGGMEFGSHTVSHPILTTISVADLDFELAYSKQTIEREIGQPVLVVAYPMGSDYGFDERVILAARRAGYRLGASYIADTNYLGSTEPFSLRRLHVEQWTHRALFKAMLSVPEVFK